MNLFSKLKDYNSELEDVLDRKYFSANVKNLLLSMIYKIENSYKDYAIIKRSVRTKDEFLTELVETIDKYCDNFKIVDPKNKGAEILQKHKVLALTNEKERSLLAYPTETALLYAISDIAPKFFYVKNEVIFKKLIQDMLVEGYNTNNLEILVNFNGWSWDTKSKSNGKYINNLIYQNFLFLVGEGVLKEWRTTSSMKVDYLGEIEDRINKLDKDNNFLLYMHKILYAKLSKKEKEQIDVKLKEKCKELVKVRDKDKYLETMKTKKLKLTKVLEKIDLTLSDENILAKEFKKRNSKLADDKKMSSIKVFINLLNREREATLVEFKEASDVLLPVNYLKYKAKLEKYEAIYKNKESIDKDIVEMEKCFLKLMEQKTMNAMTNNEIKDLIYILRYLKNVNINKDYQIKDIPALNKYIDKILKRAITRACKSGIIKIISMDINTNYEIIKFAIDGTIIELEEIKLCLEIQKGELTIKVYDKEIYDKETTIKFTGDKKDIEVKLNKTTKLFN